MATPELLTIGRISVDLYGQELGAGLADPQSFAKAVGGSATNVAVAGARLGHRTAVLTGVGQDSLGEFLIRDLSGKFGVDTSFIARVPGVRTPVVLAGLDNPGDPEFVFYREPDAPDMQITADLVPDEVVREVPVFWFTGSALSRDPSAAAVTSLLAIRDRKPHSVFDLDYRPSFWPSREAATSAIGAALSAATITIGNREECSVALGMPVETSPEDFAAALLDRGVSTAVVKRGADGVLVADASGMVTVPGIPVEVMCGLGAGDAFGGAFVHGMLSGWTPVQCVEYGNAAGAIVASRLLCSEAMPTVDEVNDFLVTAGHQVP